MISIGDIFKIGLGPSSSHTVGPMKAAAAFVGTLQQQGCLAQVQRIAVEIYGSLALTGIGHGTFDAVLLGLEGSLPHSIDLNGIPERLARINNSGSLHLPDGHALPFEVARDLDRIFFLFWKTTINTSSKYLFISNFFTITFF